MSPMTILVNIVSTHVPYISAGKQAIADDPDIYNEIRQALMDAARDLRDFLRKKERETAEKKKKQYIEMYAKHIAIALNKIVGKNYDEILAQIKRLIGEKSGQQGVST